jgi:hypothetical protein
VPYILDQLHQYEVTNGQRLLDIFTVHYYPQGGEFSNDVSTAMQLKRNRSTRSLWDPTYKDESWINDYVQLVPRLKNWVNTYYPGLQTGLTEYNWGAENHINGATTQADILGILGREGLDLATRWTTPGSTTPTYKAIKMYRNYDGYGSAFGDLNVSASIPNPDDLSAFASLRSADGALTIMVINKNLSSANTVTANLANFAGNGVAQVWQLTAANSIMHLSDIGYSGSSFSTTVPAQSITLFVVPGGPSTAFRQTVTAMAGFGGATGSSMTGSGRARQSLENGSLLVVSANAGSDVATPKKDSLTVGADWEDSFIISHCHSEDTDSGSLVWLEPGISSGLW